MKFSRIYKNKGVASLLVAGLMMGSLTGCGGEAQEPVTSDSVVQDVVETAAPAESEVVENTDPVIYQVAEQNYMPTLPTGVEASEIYVEPIEGLSEDFIKGMDISSIISLEESGVKYYNADGQEQDLFQILADAGVNYIRVRVWNDPYDSKGGGYGGGNCDVEKAAEIGKRAAECGMKLLVDFHYSDFWADPAKQKAPKEWAHMTYANKVQAMYDWTVESVNAILASGSDIGMIQIGNEINSGMAGETDWTRITELLGQASKAIRDVSAQQGREIPIAVHFTNIDNKNGIMNVAQTLEDAGLDYDIFGVSYYSFWHGTMQNLTDVLTELNTRFGKETCVMETSYAYTLEDGDGFANSVSEVDLVEGYAATVQSQATNIRDIMAATAAAGDSALGIFYWEGAWVPVGPATADNSPIWEQYGSGWASSTAKKYDPNDAGQYYGGCSWDNQAMFDFGGKKLPSLDVFKYVNYGTECEPKVDYVDSVSAELNVNEAVVLPETVNVVFNDRALSGPVAVTWNEEDIAKIDTSVMADHVVRGELEDGTAVTCDLTIAKVNYVQNPSFEEKNTTMWNVTYVGDSNPTDFQTKSSDAMTGDVSFHFWSEAEQDFNIEQTISGLGEGSYTFTTALQGGDVGDAEIYAYVKVGDTMYQSEPVKLSGWTVWQNPEVRDIAVNGEDVIVGVHVKCKAKGWGTMDDFYLYKQ